MVISAVSAAVFAALVLFCVLWLAVVLLLLLMMMCQMTRLCNSILKRLGKHEVVSKARLLMLSASVTPLTDRSGLGVLVSSSGSGSISNSSSSSSDINKNSSSGSVQLGNSDSVEWQIACRGVGKGSSRGSSSRQAKGCCSVRQCRQPASVHCLNWK
jgi:hypothetical protein